MEKNNESRVLTYVGGILHFYGVICFTDLQELVRERIGDNMGAVALRDILQTGVSQGRFSAVGDCYYDLEVADVEWVLAGQAKRDEIGYRPVSEEEAQYVAEGKLPLLWNENEKEFFRWLVTLCGGDAERAALLLLDYEAQIRNNLEPLQLAQEVVAELGLSESDEVRQAAAKVVALYKHVPLWTLKGWTPADVLYGD
ncbi:hypothetical protein [Dethiobacter alkaliphilus]|uniref:Uncharacterized protein n=1 Tax=Dethiobacter alkaliphilus AHT 1 TaxID=555088 RepID=C0GGX9_DETAL|nr:hypothetical protein [Dethiobacter alkaliphilus]EEG77281.1 hypothetical protein DealDRAFT_1738 [Dethiobacter alkaliphilus AHT 1]